MRNEAFPHLRPQSNHPGWVGGIPYFSFLIHRLLFAIMAM
jgi:hypothetical protein